MDFLFTKEQEEFREKVIALLNTAEIQEKRKMIKKANLDSDPREIYRILGEQGLLAPNFPSEFGGLNKTLIEAAILVEEMSNSGIPEALHVLTSLIIGNVILLSATKSQKEKYLPQLADGSKNACILYSEPKHGSDLSSLESRAYNNEDLGTYSIFGRKVYSMKTHISDYGLIAVRTSEKQSKYDGLSLFMVPLNSEGVTISEIPSLSDESLYEVILDGVVVDNTCMIGKENDGWSVINKALSVERTGLDYFVRAKRWFDLIYTREINNIPTESTLIELSRLRCKLDASRYLTYKVINEFNRLGAVDESLSAISKLYASELACEVVWKGHELRGVEACLKDNHGYSELYGSLESAYREAPGLTLSAGTSEMMLETISKLRLTI
ncbi:acyl-CoA dehydrogenase family protein [Rossellomorea vietnamensis]|nr:acyl-CoA dehydrogenase family protein [Rossellomorea vietnamensis]